MINRNKIIIISLLVVGLLNFCGCQSDKVAIEETSKLDNTITTGNIESTNKSEITENINSSKITDVGIQEDKLTKDEIVLNYFNEAKNSIDEFLKSEKLENIKEACKNYFVTFVDFIFYGGEIKGVTFNELTNETKIKVINLTRKIDELIMTKFPDYKETISAESKKLFESVCNLLDEGKDGVENFIIEKIGEEKYSDILDRFNTFKEESKEVFNNIKDSGSELYESGKEKIKEWYENFRES